MRESEERVVRQGEAEPRRRNGAAWPRESGIAFPDGRSSWVDRLLRRRQPTAFQRCLAVHIHFAGPRGGLS